MLVENAEPAPMTQAAAHRSAFFRQSGWLMVATISGGVLMWAVHLLSRSTGPREYGDFVAFLSVAMCLPTMPLQMVLTQQTAKALATHREGELSGMVRLAWVGTSLLWLVAALGVVLFHHSIVTLWNISNPAALWLILPVLLLSVWVPIFSGVLQGQQNFLWLGWSMLAGGIGRLVVAALVVLAFHAGAAGMLSGVVFGLVAAVGIAIWQASGIWTTPPRSFDWRGLLRQVLPLSLGFGAFQFLMTADTMFAKSYFSPATMGFYGSAGTLSRALMWLVMPLASVMFPRIVHSAARSEKTNLMGLVLVGTAILSVTGALGLWLVGPLAIGVINGPDFVKVAAELLPWYAGAMVPLTLANVLLNNLLARDAFRFVPALCVLAIGYAFALTRFHATPTAVLQTMGVCNLALLGICAWFSWADQVRSPRANLPGPEGAALG